MKTSIRQAATATVLAVVLAAPAFAMTASSQSIQQKLDAAHIDTHGLTVSVNNGVATLSGVVNDGSDRARAARIARHTDGVTRVINLITTS